MRDFFKGWRRKAGGVTLVMALVQFGLWLRSFVVLDAIRFTAGGHVHTVYSFGTRVLLLTAL